MADAGPIIASVADYHSRRNRSIYHRPRISVRPPVYPVFSFVIAVSIMTLSAHPLPALRTEMNKRCKRSSHYDFLCRSISNAISGGVNPGPLRIFPSSLCTPGVFVILDL